MIQIEISGIPRPWSAPKIGKKGYRFSPHGKDALWTKWQIKAAYTGKPIDGHIILHMQFIEPPAASTPKKKKAIMLANIIRPVRCDLTNCIKFMEDCLKNIVFNDDRYVAKNISEKLYGDEGKTLIKVWTLDEYRKINADYT